MVQPQPSPLDIGGSYPWEYCSVDRCQTCRTAFDSEDILATDCRVQCSQCKLCPRATGAARRKCRKFCRNGRKSCNDICLKGQAICFYCSPICNGLFWRWKINQILQRSNQHNDRLNDPHCYHARLAFWNIIVLPTALENHLETLQALGLDNLCLLLSSQVEENLPTKNLPTQQLVQLPDGEIFEGNISMGKMTKVWGNFDILEQNYYQRNNCSNKLAPKQLRNVLVGNFLWVIFVVQNSFDIDLS